MRPPTLGSEKKDRVWRFIETLLNKAKTPDFKVDWETDKGTGRPNFVVQTERRFLENLTQIKKHELDDVIKTLEKLEIWDDRRLKRGKGSQIGNFALKLWSMDAERNRQQFERVWQDNQPKKSKELAEKQHKSEQFDWHNICYTMLEKQKNLTTNPLMDNPEMAFDINQIHVPLALVERKKSDKRNGDDDPAKSNSYKPEYEETQKFEYEEFLAILKAPTNNKIAIIGEPGAGKTTLLQRIAFWILDNTDDLAIWIPLGNLPTDAPNLKDYLRDNWLENAIASVTLQIKADFDKQLTAGKVWLLLDGVDEMAASGNALSFINNWLPAWSQNLRLVLTCRLNIWEANPLALNGFQTYRTLEFNQEQVTQFINNCFQTRRGKPPVVAPKLGIELQQALNQPGKERIKDLVRNPLRLMLLCSIWHLQEGKLPDTKAELYQKFVDEVYRWKKDELRITPKEKKELNAKLKELALSAIDKEENRFCLRQKFVEGVLGECDDELFQFALKVGWLNRVGVDAKSKKPVYAFYHPTFQEYFAALAIKEDWGYFLNHVPDNPAQGIYRIFEPQWKEVFLLWLGREDVRREDKEEFIEALVKFDDGCGDFYEYRAYFLASVGIAEFRDCSLADKIVEQIFKCSFGCFNVEKQEWQRYRYSIEKAAKVTLPQTDCSKAIKGLMNVLATTEDEGICGSAANILARLDPGNQQVIDTLVKLATTSEDESTRWSAAKSLGEIDPGNQQAIDTLIQLLLTASGFVGFCVAESLGQIGKGNQQAIDALFHFAATYKSIYANRGRYERLEKIGIDYQQEIELLIQLLATTEPEYIRWLAADDLGKIDPSNQQAIEVLVQLSATSKDEYIRRRASESLGIFDPSNQQAIDGLVQLWTNSKSTDAHMRLADMWGAFDPTNQQERDDLVQLLATSQDEYTRWSAANSLGKIDPGNQQAVDTLVQLLATSQDVIIRLGAADNLGEIDPGNQQAVDTLVQLLATSQDVIIRLRAAESLEKIVQNRQMPSVVTALQHCLSDEVYKTDVGIFNNCYEVIWHCAQNMTYPAFHKAWHSTHLQLPGAGA